eukprot:CAMPEP_0118949464 /NCGR_PEP_ID=MMETSP1169-20130426/49666_1 /TAXON_ID=36882 /ORGANISM="Pyramimonas obovata, Strain CCMP722" /LENGTH=1253 /DNA_ID=CAMNT_0006896109 /DNA_START=163 /DNA_END=3921 /DNA_ORIENTATION=+
MRAVVTWSDKVPDRDGIKSVCYDVAFKPDGTHLVTGVGSRVLVYDAVDGDLLHSLKGHKDTVYAVAYSRDGKRFASGGADKTIIIWTHKAEGILKYQHNDSIQALEYNPVTQQLASATSNDFGLWSPEQKSVAKHKVSSKVICLSWTNDGQYLALGQFNGNISIRDKSGSEKVLIERNAPVWSICWNPSRDEPYDILACGCWDGTLSFYQLSGIQVGKDKELGYDPCSVSYFSNGEYICIGGTDQKVGLVTKEGTRLTNVAERESWVWCAKPRPKQNYVVVGCEDGTITMYQLIFSTVHGLYQDRYAYRDFMTDVIIQHLITEQKVRIKCRDYVKKIAVYKDRLAVQLPDRVIIYELSHDDAYDMHYKVSTKIQKRLQCNLLVVTSQHVILCQEKKLQLYSFTGTQEREWVLESVIRYIKVVGGPNGQEGLLIGLKSGMILKIFINNQFPIQLIKHTTSIRCLDLSASRSKLAVVDENTNAMVFDLSSKELLFEEKSANSVAWNTEMEEMFCFSGNGMLSIKTGNFPVHQQKLQGFVVGFKGSKIFCLHYVCMQTIDVPQSASLYRYLEQHDYATAYRVACLGVTENDWRLLATQALQGMSLEIARKAYIRIRDMRYIELLNRIEQGRRHGVDENLFLAEILAYQQRYQDAAKMYARSGQVKKAMEMFSDLRLFEEAKVWAEEYAKGKGGDSSAVQDLINKQAEWSEEVNDYEAAADMYLKARKFDRAIAIIGKNQWADKLAEVMRLLQKGETKLLQTCAAYFRKWGSHGYAKETYIKLNDLSSLLVLHVESEKWEEAFMLLKSAPEHKDKVYLPYAKYLALHDQFDEARLAYKKAGRPEQSTFMLEQLCHNAVVENRFNDAGYYFWSLARECMDQMTSEDLGDDIDLEQSLVDASERDHMLMRRFRELHARAQVYYAYHYIYTSVEEPFHSNLPSTLLNIGRFLLCKFNELQAENHPMPHGVSLAYVLNILGKHGEELEAFKTARFAYNKLQGLKMPPAWHDDIDLACVMTRAKPFSDKEDLLPVCYRCATQNPLVNAHGDVCINCGAAFQRSFVTFEHLPLVEFALDHGITDQEAMQLLDQPPPQGQKLRAVERGGGRQQDRGDGFREKRHSADVQTLRFDEDEEEEPIDDSELFGDLNMDDPFQQQMAVPHAPIRATRQILQNLDRSEVLVRTFPTPALPNQYFRIMDLDLPMVLDDAGNFYEQDEYEGACLDHGYSPFTREPPETVKKPGEVAPPDPPSNSLMSPIATK